MSSVLQTVKSVLASPSARRMDFHFGLIHVNAVALNLIHELIANRVVFVDVVKSGNSAIEAQYNVSSNTIELPHAGYGTSVEETATILHECVHALHDIYGAGHYHPQAGSRFMRQSENEAAGYVAGALYSLYESGQPLTGDPIFDIAGAIAKRIMNRRGAFVSTAEADNLRRAIVKRKDVYNYDYDDLTVANGR